MADRSVSRRDLLQTSAVAGGAWLLMGRHGVRAADAERNDNMPETESTHGLQRLPDLRPARWIWYPSGRCLPNTFILFRRALNLAAPVKRATGWIVGDSRYTLYVNGQRVQFGPPPCDPRYIEADPLELTALLQPGENVIGAQVLYYGHGDGTWPIGKPGFLFWLEIEHADGRTERIVSDASWQAHYARAWRPGQYKRWYLRALQEDFDARLFPHGWATAAFKPDASWRPAMPLNCPPDKPAVCSSYPDYHFEIGVDGNVGYVIPRQVPMMRESIVPVARLAESMWIDWRCSPEEYFECTPPDSFDVDRTPCTAVGADASEWTIDFAAAGANRAAALTFEFTDQMVGWPRFTIDAPAGTIVELMVQEAHEVGGPPLLNTHFHSWSRFTCREGTNVFETFDFESCRWMQLHIRAAVNGKVRIRDVGMRRRVFPWPHEPNIRIAEPALQRLMDATINTLHNCAQENCVDGMGRERQQYSGDCGHQLHAIWMAFGETRLPARYLRTYSQGMTRDGFFLDCWPAYDRLCRVMCREIDLAGWGPILDHGVGFNFDCLYHYLYTGDTTALAEPFPRLVRFAKYLESIRGRDGLLPVENLGVPCVWMDHIGFARQAHKQCSFNLYAAAMLEYALPTLCRLFDDGATAAWAEAFGRELRQACVKQFWHEDRRLFVDNLPWLATEKGVRTHDRTLATAVLFGQCPGGDVVASVKSLADCPGEMGFSYPANAGWRLWALAKAGRGDVVIRELRERWATMPSVRLNNTLAEDWECRPDSGSQWSHCPVAPVYVLYMSVAGIRPLEPGFTRCEIRPQLADLGDLDLTARTVRGPIRLTSKNTAGGRELTLSVPPGCTGELVLPRSASVSLPKVERTAVTVDRAAGFTPEGHARYLLMPGQTATVVLPA
ncbi:MAG TPA: alpha-L-rhamnosidase N-terminal domain-containing protein [Phycisphaerae bacterium]|nr:alpha-L-rhamnosidase N-terminal domain-containing protein [Phycisphaerae bacterium]